MSEWRFFDEGEAPEFTTPEFFRRHPWVPPEAQPGHAERTAMAAALIRRLAAGRGLSTWCDLGCGDGALLKELHGLPGVLCWGWDAGEANVAKAREAGLDVDRGDILTAGRDDAPGPVVDVAEGVSACEVLEHLADPHGWLARLARTAARYGVFSSPSAEDGVFHYEHHAWAWDPAGYAAMVAGAGWEVVEHVECDAPEATHGGVTRPQRFQAVVAVRP